MNITFGAASPDVAPDAWVAPTAVLSGSVAVASATSVWFGAVLRGDGDEIRIGERSNVQDGVVVHSDRGFPVTVGQGVSVGHRAVLHGCTVGDGSLIGMGAMVLNGATVGSECLVAAGAVVLEGTVVPDRSLVAGVPARVRRDLTDDEVEKLRTNARDYLALMRAYRDAPAR